MPSGGARTRSGPPPDPDALRRDKDSADWIVLPAAGRPGAAPKWPLTKPTTRERSIWRRLWASPQAIEWERHQLVLEVALYVRRLVEAEVAHSPAAISTLVRQMGDSLGLTMTGMRANRWRVEAEELEADAAPQSGRPSLRDRFQVVHGGA